MSGTTIHGVRVTAREADVWRGVAKGQVAKTIATAYGISDATVKWHTGQLMKKAGVTNRVQLALKFHGIEF